MQIAHEMDIVCNIPKTFSLFEINWKEYVEIIERYSATVQTKDIQKALESVHDDEHSDEDAREDGISHHRFVCTK